MPGPAPSEHIQAGIGLRPPTPLTVVLKKEKAARAGGRQLQTGGRAKAARKVVRAGTFTETIVPYCQISLGHGRLIAVTLPNRTSSDVGDVDPSFAFNTSQLGSSPSCTQNSASLDVGDTRLSCSSR